MGKYTFNAEDVKNRLVAWLRDWFAENGNGCNAVVGMSGGKDSTIVAALCVEALGKDRVIGVSMPDGEQGENDADRICAFLGIRYIVAPITNITTGIKNAMFIDNGCEVKPEFSKQAEQNIPPRARMLTLYAISQSNNGRVVGTCNLSEDVCGYFTVHGDGASDVEPLANLTVTEVRHIGDALGVPKEWVWKTPDDGLPHSCSDEEKLGFTYAALDLYLRGQEVPEASIKEKMDDRMKKNAFKMKPKAKFEWQ